MTTRPSKWQKMAEDKDGHRLFTRCDVRGLAERVGPPADVTGVRPRLFVADRSGPTPDQTDDASRDGKPVEISSGVHAIVIEPSNGFLVANLPTTDDKRVHLSIECAMEVARLWDLPVQLHDRVGMKQYTIDPYNTERGAQ